MPDQVVPITQLDQTGVILDTPPVALPPNAFTNARNVRFKDGAVRKMEGEVNIFPEMDSFFGLERFGEVAYIAWWPSPNQTVRDAGYYILVIENITDPANITHDIYAILPGAEHVMADDPETKAGHYHRLGSGFNRQGKWQHTLFNGGFTFIINNGIEKPQYVTDPQDNINITMLALADLPGWDSYEVNELILRDVFTDTSSRVFDTGQTFTPMETRYIVTRTRSGGSFQLSDGVQYNTVRPGTNYPSTAPSGLAGTMNNSGQDVIVFGVGELLADDEVSINFQSVNPVEVRAAIVRAFGDFLVAGNLVERDSVTAGNPIIRRLTGVVRSSDVAQPGSIPNNWNPFAAGASTADEFVIADTGTVQDMVPLQGNLYLYTNSSISVMRPTGNPTIPLAVQPVTDQYGALTTDAVLEYDGKHFVIGSDDIYLFGGHPGSIQSISDQKVRRSFFERVNPINDNLINLFTLRYAARDEIWICFPTVDSVRGESDEAYIWNYRNGTWTIRTLQSVIRGDIGPVPGGGVPSAIITLDGESGNDAVTDIGALEVQTFQVSSDAHVGQPLPGGRAEVQTFSTQREVGGTARPAIRTNTTSLTEVAIGLDVHAGPNPTTAQWNLTNPDTSFTFDTGVLNGGAQLIGTVTDIIDGTATDTQIEINADEIFGAATRIQESGTADDAVVFDSNIGVTSRFVDRSSSAISGSNTANTGTGITTSATTNVVSNSDQTPVTVTTAIGTTSHAYQARGTGSVSVTPTYTTGGQSSFNMARTGAGSVTASFTSSTRTDSSTVPADWSASGGGVISGFAAANNDTYESNRESGPMYLGTSLSIAAIGRLASILSGNHGTNPARAQSATFGSNIANLRIRGSIHFGINSGNIVNPSGRLQSENGGARTFVENGVTYTCCITRTSTELRYVGQGRQGGLAAARPFIRIRSTGRATYNPIGGIGVFYGHTFSGGGLTGNFSNFRFNYPGDTVTTSTQTQVRTLNSVTNNTDADITFAWDGTNRNISPSTSATSVNVSRDTTSTSWVASGSQGRGTLFTNNAVSAISSFTPTGLTASTLAASGTRDAPTRLTTWTGTTPAITVTNTNSDGHIDFDGDTDGRVNGGDSQTFLNHSGTWSFSGERNIIDAHTFVDFTRLGGNPIDQFMFSAGEGTGATRVNGIISTAAPTPFSSGDVATIRINDGNVRTTYDWTFSGNVRGTGDQVTSGTTQTSAEFLTRAATAINADNVVGLTNWQTAYVPSPSPGSLRLISDDAGQRNLTGFQFATNTTRSATISGSDLGPHSGLTTVINDNLDIELFTVTRTDNGMTADPRYTYTVTTSRDTGFSASDEIIQLQFRSGGMAYNPTDEIFNRTVSPFTFTSNSDSFTIRAGPAATYVALQEETFTASGTGAGAMYNSNMVSVTETPVSGGFNTGDRTGSLTVENVNVAVGVTSAVTSQTLTITGGNINSPFNFFGQRDGVTSRGFNGVIARLPAGQTLVMADGTRYGPGTYLTGFLNAVTLNDASNYRSASEITFAHAQILFGTNGQNLEVNGDDAVANTDQNYVPGNSACVVAPNTVYTYSQTSNRRWRLINTSGRGYYLATQNFELLRADGHPCNQQRSFWMDATLRRPTSMTFTLPTGTFIETSPESRSFTVTNNNDYGITFNYQGGNQNIVVPARTFDTSLNPPAFVAGTSGTLAGTVGSSNSTWRWVNNPISSGSQTGDQVINSVPVDSQATTISSSTTLYQAGRAGAQRSFTAGQFKFAHISFPRNSATSVDMVRVSDGTVFQSRNNNNGGDSFPTYGFTPITTDMTHSAGTGATQAFSVNLQGSNSGNISSVTAIGGGTISAAQDTAIRGLATRRVGTGGNAYTQAYGGIGVVYANNVAVMWNTHSDFEGRFNGRHQFGQRYLGSTTAGTVTAFANRVETSQVTAERFSISNPHPFPLTFTAGGVETNIPADTPSSAPVVTNAITGSGNTWSYTTPTTTSYQYTLTNNNIRPIDIAAGSTWSTNAITGLANGGIIRTGFNTTPGFTASITREILQGAASAPTIITATANQNGMGDLTAPNDQMPVTYRFSNAGIGASGLTIDIALPRDTGTPDRMPTNVQVEEMIVTALRANSDFNDYFEVQDHNDDDAIAPGRFDIIARALPGATITDADGSTRTMPTEATIFGTAVASEFGGNAALSFETVPGVSDSDAVVSVNIRTTTNAFNPATGMYDGAETEILNEAVMISGTFAAGVTDTTMPDPGRNQLNEIFRRAYRNDAAFSDHWNITNNRDTLDPDDFQITSRIVGDHINTVTTTPTMIGTTNLAPYFQHTTTTEGLASLGAADPVFPSIRITPPSGEVGEPIRTIVLRPDHLSPAPTQRLFDSAIAEIIRNNFNLNDDGTAVTNTNWAVQESLIIPNIVGTGIVGSNIKIYRTSPAAVTGGDWTWSIASYGNTMTTLPGIDPTTDGTTIGRLNPGDFTRTGVGNDNLDFRGANILRAQPTRIMLTISNPDSPNGIQYLPFVFGAGDAYNVITQLNNNGMTATNVPRVSASDMINAIESGINNANRRITTSRSGNTLTILPSQYSGLANFILGVTINDSASGVDAWNAIIRANTTLTAINDPTITDLLISDDNGGIQSYGPDIVVDQADTQPNPSATRMPNRTNTVFTSMNANPPLITNTSLVNTVFDPLRPWPTSQVNLNREYPIFINSILNDATGELTQTIRGADIGFLFLDQQYESFIERIELALTPEFDTEQLGSLAIWADGGSRVTFGSPIEQATLSVKLYGTNSPGETLGQYNNMPFNRNETDNRLLGTTMLQNTVDNQFLIGQDYKTDIRVHGRFINILISDYLINDMNMRDVNPNNMAMDTNLNVRRGISWNISGLQAEIQKGGRR